MKFLLPLALVLTVVLGYLAYSQRADKAVEVADSEPPAAATKHRQPQVQVALEPAPESAPVDHEPVIPRPMVPRSERHDLTAQAPVISQAELERRAAKVEQETNHELARLVKLLDLTEDQQDKIFATLAQNSPDYHPSMGLASANNQPLAFVPSAPALASNELSASGKGSQITTETTIWDGTVGIGNLVREDVQGQVNSVTTPTVSVTNTNTAINGLTEPAITSTITGNNTISDALNKTTTSIEDLVAPYLTGPQQNTLSEEESDRIAWWAELTTNLAAGLGTPAVDGPTSAPQTSAPETLTQTYDDSL